MSLLAELYYGNIRPFEKYFKPNSKEEKLSQYISEQETKLLKTLSPNQTTLYNNIIKASLERECLFEESSFIYGFKLGSNIILNILNNEKSLDE